MKCARTATVLDRQGSIDAGFKFCNHHNAIFWTRQVGSVTHDCVKDRSVHCKLNGTFSATAVRNSSPCTGLAGHAVSAIPHCLVTANDYLQHLDFAVRAYQGDAKKMQRHKLAMRRVTVTTEPSTSPPPAASPAQESLSRRFKFCNHHQGIFWTKQPDMLGISHVCMGQRSVNCRVDGAGMFSPTAIKHSVPCSQHAIASIPHCLVTVADYIEDDEMRAAIDAYQDDAKKMKRHKLTLPMGAAQSRENKPFVRERKRKRRLPEREEQDCPPFKRKR